MSVWKVARVARVSSLTGAAFPPATEVVTALFGAEEEVGEDRVRGTGFSRRDYLPEEATPERLAGAFCVWRTRTPDEAPRAEQRLDLDMAREFLERLLAEAREDRGAVMMALALLLVRKRRLNLVSQGEDVLVARWPREERTFRVPAPALTEADAEALQQELARLFQL
jgi:hypothetical protein